MTRRLAALATAVLPALLVAACTQGPGDASRPPADTGTPSGSAGPHDDSWDTSQMPDPCLTVSRADVTAASGLKVSAGSRLDSWPPLCSFTVPGPAQEFLYISADPRPAARDDYTRQRSDSQATEAVPGIGDDAYWLPEFTALHVLSGATHLTVKFAGSAPPAGAKTKALAIARAALK